MGLLSGLFGPKKPEAVFVQVTDDNFKDEVIESEVPLMLFVWSNSCPYCKKMAPNVKAVAGRHADSIRAAHTSGDLAPKAVGALNIRGVPAVLFFNKGKVVENVAGFRPEQYLDDLIHTHFGSKDIEDNAAAQ